jgi:hypothetical protein
MAKKIQTFLVTAPFNFDDQDYAPGDEFVLPGSWDIDQQHTDLTHRLTFYQRTKIKVRTQNGVVEDWDTKRVSLPVESVG